MQADTAGWRQRWPSALGTRRRRPHLCRFQTARPVRACPRPAPGLRTRSCRTHRWLPPPPSRPPSGTLPLFCRCSGGSAARRDGAAAWPPASASRRGARRQARPPACCPGAGACAHRLTCSCRWRASGPPCPSEGASGGSAARGAGRGTLLRNGAGRACMAPARSQQPGRRGRAREGIPVAPCTQWGGQQRRAHAGPRSSPPEPEVIGGAAGWPAQHPPCCPGPAIRAPGPAACLSRTLQASAPASTRDRAD
jgi:hypothetical protein